MAFVEWTPELEVGHPEMDAQHQRLLAIINEYHEALERKAPQSTLIETFAKVADFAAYHFADEEALMAQCGFPQLSRHRRVHQQLVNRVSELMGDLRAERVGAARDIQFFLKLWLTAHIQDIDRQYLPYVAKPKQAVAAA